jgi:S1-C subfamily serine protease
MDSKTQLISLPGRAMAVLVFLGLFLVNTAAVAEDWGRPLGSNYGGPEVQKRQVEPQAPLDPVESHTIQVFDRATPSVVFIINSTVMHQLFSRNEYEVPQGAGSGFVWSEKGYIVTNFHVVHNADSLSVVLADQSTHEARVVGVDPDHDLAVLQIQLPREKLPAILIGSSHDLRVGQKVLAIGNPFGLDHTLTTGVVSALNRSIESMTNRTIENVIQIDAAINPGNSGGPLLDSAGRLIGINTMIVSPSGGFSGIGFAVPVDTINEVVPQLIRDGKIMRAGMGISLMPDSVARRSGLQGVIIAEVAPGGPAERAGLRGTTQSQLGRTQFGDVIVAVDGEPVHAGDELVRLLGRHKIGEQVRLQVVRDGARRQVPITLEAM